MASIGHVAVGIAVARAFGRKDAPPRQLRRSMVILSLLSLFPDLDVIAFAFGIPYEHEWGHRGATHSLAFGLLFGLAAVAVAKPARLPLARTFWAVTLVVASHGVLDSFTDGGLGCALLWPFSLERYFAPVTPIPVAPIGHYMFSARGALVIAVELILFSPLFLYATFPRKKAAPVSAG